MRGNGTVWLLRQWRPHQLSEEATLSILLLLPRECCARGCLKHLTHTLLGLGRALKEGVGTDLLSHGSSLLSLDGLLLTLEQLTTGGLVVPEVLLVAVYRIYATTSQYLSSYGCTITMVYSIYNYVADL